MYILFFTGLRTPVFYNTHFLFKFQNRLNLGIDKPTAEMPLQWEMKECRDCADNPGHTSSQTL